LLKEQMMKLSLRNFLPHIVTSCVRFKYSPQHFALNERRMALLNKRCEILQKSRLAVLMGSKYQ
jgi:hypothetical protein